MRAIRLVEPRRFDLVNIRSPSPGPRDAVVRVEAVAICGSDLAAYLGRHPRLTTPVILGHEFAGVVEKVGAEVTGIEVGTRVAVNPTVGCTRCRYCTQRQENICPSYRVIGENLSLPGAMAGRVRVAADHLHPLPPSISFEEGALVQPLAVGLHAVRDRGLISPGESILIVGAGPIGLSILIAARNAGARVLISDYLSHRLERAVELGASLAIDARSDVAAVARRNTGGYGVDASFEAAGGTSGRSFAAAYAATSRGGRVVVVGSFSVPSIPLPVGDLKSGEIDVRGSQAHPAVFGDVIGSIAAGATPARQLISHRLTMSEVGAALRMLAAGRDHVQKVVLVPDDRPPASQ